MPIDFSITSSCRPDDVSIMAASSHDYYRRFWLPAMRALPLKVINERSIDLGLRVNIENKFSVIDDCKMIAKWIEDHDTSVGGCEFAVARLRVIIDEITEYICNKEDYGFLG